MLEAKFTRRLGEFTLDIGFEIQSEILVLFGASGAGKTMTLNCLAGLVEPDDGVIRLDGKVLYDSRQRIHIPTRQRKIGYVFQNYALFPHLNVRDNIAFGIRESREARKRVDDMLALAQLDEWARRFPSQLSGGQQQRVALARALAPRPALLLLDEPFSALDAPTRMQLRHELRDLQREFKIPTVFVTHDLGEAYFLADKIAVIQAGKILQMDAPGEILRHPHNLLVARAVGVKNILPGTVISRDSTCTRVRVGNAVVDAPSSTFDAGARVLVCLRSERIMLVRPGRESRLSGENSLHGHVLREMSDGTNVTLYFRVDPPRLTPDLDYDLQIELPVYIYERLDLAEERLWTVSLRKNAIHLINAP